MIHKKTLAVNCEATDCQTDPVAEFLCLSWIQADVCMISWHIALATRGQCTSKVVHAICMLQDSLHAALQACA